MYLVDEECKFAHTYEFEKNVRMITLSSDASYSKDSKEQTIIKAVFNNNSKNADELYPSNIREIVDK